MRFRQDANLDERTNPTSEHRLPKIMNKPDTYLHLLVVVGLFILLVPLLMMSLMWVMMGGMMGGMMGPMGGSIVFALLPLLVALGIGYGGYKLWTRDGDRDEVASDSDIDPIERLHTQYMKGELTEGELEQKLENQLAEGNTSDSAETDSSNTPGQRTEELEQ